MADQPVVQIGENSPEQVAYKLMETIAKCEGVALSKNQNAPYATREWILTTYRDCYMTIRGIDLKAERLTRQPPINPPGG